MITGLQKSQKMENQTVSASKTLVPRLDKERTETLNKIFYKKKKKKKKIS